MKTRSIFDPLKRKFYEYDTRDAKAERLFEALELALKDQCPPDRKDYLCLQSEAEEQDCETCLMRYATATFGRFRK